MDVRDQFKNWFLISGVLFSLGLGPMGCSSPTSHLSKLGSWNSSESKKKSKPELPPSGPTTVIADGTAIALGQPEADLAARSRFDQRFIELNQQGRTQAAELLVTRHPDLALPLLQTSQITEDANRLQLAAAYDRLCNYSPENGWQAILNNEVPQPAVVEYMQMRSKWMATLTEGKFLELEKMPLITTAQKTNQPLLLTDALHQGGIGWLLMENPQQAAAAFRQAVLSAPNQLTPQTVESLLLESEALRRAGDMASANERWNQAVQTAADMLILPRPIATPTMWERIAYLKPVGMPWPGCVGQRFQELALGKPNPLRTDLLRQLAMSASMGSGMDPQCWVHSAIGSWHQERGNSQEALIELKKAETKALPQQVAWVHIAQGRALNGIGQTGPATALLMQMISRQDGSPEMYAAMCDLGIFRLQSGATQAGVHLLRKSLEKNTAVGWPGRNAAEADYALGLLMLGESQKGTERLMASQQRFEAEGEVELLAKSLWNQQKYLEEVEPKNQEAKQWVAGKLTTLRL
ncbi:Hypothetical protein PBC10988_6130 [Planctomycetales bacterium 10988]|nr:Hypothetical protein PBC10988_6130 [Planctomycetales bacterium 10988]